MILRAREGGETTVSQTASKHLECLLKIPGSGSSSKAIKLVLLVVELGNLHFYRPPWSTVIKISV